MTTIDVDTSPLEAAREWRGINLVAAAMNAGLTLAQAEALEGGDPGAFGSIDEMIAAAVVYGATIGIGRDEAVALLDRTVCGTGPRVALPDAQGSVAGRPSEGFSGAVQARSAQIAARTAAATVTVPVEDQDEAWVPRRDRPAETGLDVGPDAPTPEQAVTASGEIHIDSSFGPHAPWERSSPTGELEAWVDEYEDDDERGYDARGERHAHAIPGRIATGLGAALERLLGTERADAVTHRVAEATAGARATGRQAREHLRRSEHATLILAIGGGAVLIALLVALGGAIGGSEDAAPAQRDVPAAEVAATEQEAVPANEAASPEAAPRTPTAESRPPARPRPMVAPARLTLDIYNAGSRKGYAKEVAARLKSNGYRIGEVTNAQGRYGGATIIHPRGLAREARVLARRTGISTLQVAPGTSRRITIVVT